MRITSLDQLRELYNAPMERAVNKQLPKLDKHCKHFISRSPFAIIATVGSNGSMDASPRGGKKGFVSIYDDHRIIIPDAKGNNRLDSLENIIETGCIGILFLIPGIDETLRLNGKAYLSADPQLLERFSDEKNPPKTVIVVAVEEVFLHCAKALMRSELWKTDSMMDPADFPTMGEMLKDQIGASGVPESREEMVKRYRPDL